MKRLLLAALLATSSLHAERPNILLIITDDQRPDTIGRSDIVQTPNLDGLMARGTTFTTPSINACWTPQSSAQRAT